nr:immunoglobulin heavy chain junction region [Macaca mulatta]
CARPGSSSWAFDFW